MSGCPGWIGIEPPVSVDCQKEKGHSGRHWARLDGSIKSQGAYVTRPIVVTWPKEQAEGAG